VLPQAHFLLLGEVAMYSTIQDLPDGVRTVLPEAAQHLWLRTFNKALQAGQTEEACAQAAWQAVADRYTKGADGRWVPKPGGHESVVAGSNDGVGVEALAETDAEFKTENGVRFPREAYLYAPADATPSEWKLRVWETPELKVTRAQLGRAAAALSPGGFRGQQVVLPPDALAACKRKLVALYRKLGVDDTEIPAYLLEAADVAESAAPGQADYTHPVVVIQAGTSLNGNHYPPSTLRQAVAQGLFEGAKAFADHNDKTSVRDLVGWLSDVTWDEGKQAVVGNLHIVAPWLRELVQEAQRSGKPDLFGLSIRATGKTRVRRVGSRMVNYVESIETVKSVDVVTEPAAGGGFVQEASTRTKLQEELAMLEALLAALKLKSPALAEQLEKELAEATSDEARAAVLLKLIAVQPEPAVVAAPPTGPASATTPTVTAAYRPSCGRSLYHEPSCGCSAAYRPGFGHDPHRHGHRGERSGPGPPGGAGAAVARTRLRRFARSAAGRGNQPAADCARLPAQRVR